MNVDEIFEKGKRLAEDKGKFKDYSQYIPLCSLVGDFFIIQGMYKYKKNGLTINYFKSQCEDGNGKEESLSIYERKNFFSLSEKVYHVVKTGEKLEEPRKLQRGDWEETFEKLSY